MDSACRIWGEQFQVRCFDAHREALEDDRLANVLNIGPDIESPGLANVVRPTLEWVRGWVSSLCIGVACGRMQVGFAPLLASLLTSVNAIVLDLPCRSRLSRWSCFLPSWTRC